MTRTLVLATVALAACASPAPRDYGCELPEFDEDHPRAAALQAFVDEERIANQLPGLSLAVRDADGLWLGSSGYVDLDTMTPRTACVPQPIASFTKLMTGVSVHQQVEAGLLSYEDTAGAWLPDELIGEVENAGDASLEVLLNHTGGVGDFLELSNLTQAPTLEEFFASVAGVRGATPGEFSYSNPGYIMLGLMVAEATAQRHSDVVLSELLEPLGMDSTFYGRARPVPLDSLARGYISQGSGGSFIEFELANQSYAITDFDPAAGGAASTVGDMVILLDAVFRDQTVLEPTTTDELLSFVDTPDSFAGGLVSGYGLGVLELDAAAPGHGASGSLLSFGSDGYYLPEQDITYAMAYNGQSTQVADMNRRLVELLTQP